MTHEAKKCIHCERVKPLSDFGAKRPGQLRGECKACRSIACKRYYVKWRKELVARSVAWSRTPTGRVKSHANKMRYKALNKEQTSAAEKLKKRSNVAPWMLYQARLKAKRAGYVCDLEVTDLILPSVCPALGIDLFIGEGKMSQNSPSLDRIDNAKGYIKGNVVIVSVKANSMKNSATVEELGKVYRFYKRLKAKIDRQSAKDEAA